MIYCVISFPINVCDRSLLKAGAGVERQTEMGSTPLVVASGGGHRDIVKILIQHGANINHLACDRSRSSAISEAIDNGHSQVRKLIHLLTVADSLQFVQQPNIFVLWLNDSR